MLNKLTKTLLNELVKSHDDSNSGLCHLLETVSKNDGILIVLDDKTKKIALNRWWRSQGMTEKNVFTIDELDRIPDTPRKYKMHFDPAILTVLCDVDEPKTEVSLVPKQTPIRKFIEANRQTGSTTTLVKTVIQEDGILVVSHSQMKNRLLEKHNDIGLRDHHVYTTFELSTLSGFPTGKKVFVDTDVVFSLTPAPEGIETSKPKNDKLEFQLNVRLTGRDLERLKLLNDAKFDGEASDALVARQALRRGMDEIEKETVQSRPKTCPVCDGSGREITVTDQGQHGFVDKCSTCCGTGMSERG